MKILNINENYSLMDIKTFMCEFNENTVDNLTIKLKASINDDTIDVNGCIPIVGKSNILGTDTYMQIEDNTHIIDEADFTKLLDDDRTIVTDINLLNNNNIYTHLGKCLSDECFLVQTRLSILLDIPIKPKEITLVDMSSKVTFIHIEVPTVTIGSLLENITGYDSYFINAKTTTGKWLSVSFYTDLFTKNINSIKNNSVRNLIWHIRKKYPNGITDLSQIMLNQFYNDVDRLIEFLWIDGDITELTEDFPILSVLSNKYTTELSRVTFIGDLHKLDIVVDNIDENISLILFTLRDNLKDKQKTYTIGNSL